jgi:hemerythrin-like domain-containing protein
MPIVIGAKRESDFSDPIGMLGDCHRRIERFLNALLTVATSAKGGPLTSEQQTALAASLRYFLEAAPKHTADEEESLFPRLTDSIIPICNLSLQESILCSSITNAPRNAIARWNT